MQKHQKKPKITRTADLLRELRRQGIEVTKARRGGHYKAYCPGGIVIISDSPSEYRGAKNLIAEFRRRGVDL